MRPQITIKTSYPLQEKILDTDTDEETMADLRETRDALIDRFADTARVLDHMEDISGLAYQEFQVSAWVYNGGDAPIASPILIPARDDTEIMYFELLYMMSKELIYQNLRDLEQHEMLEPGYEALDVTAGLIAYRSLARIEDNNHVDSLLDNSIFGGDQLKTWRKVQDHAEDWDPAKETLLEYLGIEITADEDA
ncbi:MAG: hypothetical protein MUP66_02110 [Candidatus Nanohaloarchaeota archaeon QJJ-5]|nr:hypothetical protein [Candidatus Nanohaloarchaeota archaeon QJJ-5]